MNKKALFTLIFDLFILICIVFSFLLTIIPEYEQSYTAGLLDKAERLQSIKDPKIVLVGNSNLAFGIDSQKIEEELGMPVVNMGLHGGLGNAFHEEMAKLNVTKGDIYVICHTTFSDDNEPLDATLLWTTLEDHIQLWSLLRKEDIPVMIDALPIYIKKCINLWGSGMGNKVTGSEYYRRDAFNKYGDVSIERPDCRIESDNSKGIHIEARPEINDICIDRLNELNHHLTQNGASMVVAGYPILVNESVSDDYINYINNFEAELQMKLECAVISDYKNYFYTKPLFFDATYHLNDTGVALRTEQLISDLKAFYNF